MRTDRAERDERRRLHLERSIEIDEAVAEVRHERETAAGLSPGSAPEWDEVTLAAVRSLLGLVQRHRAGDLVLVEPGSGLAVRIRHDGERPSARLVVVPPADGAPPSEDVVDAAVSTGTDDRRPDDRLPDDPPDDRRDDVVGGVPAPRQPGDAGEPPRALHPDVREELAERRRAAWQRLTRDG